ncbi:DNA-binding IclR family transcriptional regulator [Kineosphaera limosa]|nr:DNA-binding IclR family transcriptional regulator [Kineosphaera limosa]
MLEIVSSARTPLTVSELAERAGLHRSIVYRLVRTLEDHRLIARDTTDRFGPATGLLSLATHVSHDLTTLSAPALQRLADATGLAALLVIREGGQAATVLVVEPSEPLVPLSHCLGSRHDLDVGAPGHALRSFDAPSPHDHAQVRRARTHGWASSHGEVIDGASCVAAPLAGYRTPAAIAVCFLGQRDLTELSAQVVATAHDISQQLASA